MLDTLIFRGIFIGLLASIPLGPIAVLCIQRTLSKNHKSGFISGLGAATADAIFATVAFFSLAVVMGFIETHITLVKVIGGMCVMVVGVKIFLSNPVVQIRRNRAGKTSLGQDYLSILLLTLANPTFILVLIGLFAALGISENVIGEFNGWLLISGVFIGSSTWWFILTFLVSLFRAKFRPRHLLWMNRIAGVIIMVLGAATVLTMFINIPMNELLQQ